MTRIDTLAPDDRALVRRVAVFGLTFHPRMLSWLYAEEDGPPPDARPTLGTAADIFDDEPDGYLRFRQSLLRDSAYEGLPFKLRRQLHARRRGAYRRGDGFPGRGAGHAVAALLRRWRVHAPAWRLCHAGREACGSRLRVRRSGRALCPRAGSRRKDSPTLRKLEIGRTQEVARRSRGTGPANTARRSTPTPPRRSRLPASRCSRPTCCSSYRASRRNSAKYPEALRWVERARERPRGRCRDTKRDRQNARLSAWYADGAAGAGPARKRRSSGPSKRRAKPRMSTIPKSPVTRTS